MVMEELKDQVPRTLYLYNTSDVLPVLNGLSLASSEHQQAENTEVGEVMPTELVNLENLTVSDKMSCASCGVTFDDRSQQVEHFRSDWHRYNLKQRLRNREAVSEDTFHDMTDDVSSISGSESDSDGEGTRQGALLGDALSPSPPHDSDAESLYHVEGLGRRHPRVFLRNARGDLISVYRAVVHGKKNQPESEKELIAMVTDLPKQTKWLVLMLAGGHFAGAVFDGQQIVCHTTFHRYVVRAKRGTVQSSRDNQGNAPKSVGAFMRRHHEAALTEDIKKLLIEWAEHVKSCDRIFLRATGSARQTFFNSKAPLVDKQDTRIRLIPFPTRRPTHKEVQRVREVLATVQCHGTQSQLSDHIRAPGSPRRAPQVSQPGTAEKLPSPRMRNKKPEQPKAVKCQEFPYTVEEDSSDSDVATELGFSEELVDLDQLKSFQNTPVPRKKKKKKIEQIDVRGEPVQEEIKVEEPIDPFAGVDVFCGLKNELYTAVKTGDAAALEHLLLELADLAARAQIPPGVSVNSAVNDTGARLLHLACREAQRDCIAVLLSHGADPAVKNGSGGLPYLIAKEKSVRNEFRKFRAEFPDKYDYSAAHIPSPLTGERESERKAKEAERRKAARKAKNARLKEQKEEDRKAKEEEKEKERFLNLSDREKRALAAEKRLLVQVQSQGAAMPTAVRCFECGGDMTGKVPFEYSDNVFCTSKCLQAHRKAQRSTGKASAPVR